MNNTALKLLKSSENSNFASFEQRIRSLPIISSDSHHLSPINTGGTSTLSAFVVRAALQLAKGSQSEIGVIRTSEGSYASEWAKASGETVVATLVRNGEIRVSVISAAGSFATAGTVGGTRDSFDTSSIIAMYLCQICENPGGDAALEPLSKSVSDDLATLAMSLRSGQTDTDVLYRLSDAISEYFQSPFCKCVIKNGSFPLIAGDSIKAKAFAGELLYGRAEMLMPGTRTLKNGYSTFADTAKLFRSEREENRKRFSSKEFLERIPKFPDDYLVPEEVIDICDWYTSSHDDPKPARNFMIRGITGVGKSKDCELVSAVLGLPLFRLTCFSEMQGSDFLSTLVPVTQSSREVNGELPTAADIWLDPEGAYTMLTGEEKEEVTPDEALDVYTEVVAERSSGTDESKGSFKRVDTEYIKAIISGSMVEIQELSRMKDQGAAVIVNEYDHINALIPLIDGTYERRHSKALTIWTDNLGYSTCKPPDPALMRRMDAVYDLEDIDKDMVVERAMYNSHSAFDRKVVEALFDAWDAVRIACIKQGIDEGDPSPSDLENLVSRLVKTGMEKLYKLFRVTVLAKTTTDRDERENLFNSVALPKLDAVLKLYNESFN